MEVLDIFRLCKFVSNSAAICLENIQVFIKNVQWHYLGCELGGNNTSYWVMSNIMSQIKRFKNKSEGLVLP